VTSQDATDGLNSKRAGGLESAAMAAAARPFVARARRVSPLAYEWPSTRSCSWVLVGQALEYAVPPWVGLVRNCENRALLIDNKMSEASVRP